MKTITTKTKVYKYDELPEEAKQKVLESLYYINTDYEWFDMTVSEDFPSQLNEIGLSGSKFYFDLDRGSYLYCDDLGIDNIEKLLKTVKCDLRTKVAKEIINNGLSIGVNNYSMGSGSNYIDLGYGVSDTPESQKLIEKLQELLQDTMENFRIQLQKEYEYLISQEAIEETIKCNDYDFTINGKIF
jgi:hypothetical protein